MACRTQFRQEVISDLVSFGVRFEKNGEEFLYTREGAHSHQRILFHEDETGKEITSHLLETARARENITIIENYTMVDLICEGNECHGIIGHDENGVYSAIQADYTVLATGGIGGIFEHSTNYKHLTGDAIALALKYGIKLQHIDYIQIHPTTLYESLKTTNRYLHPYAESMKEASEKMERIIRGKTDGEMEIHLSSGE